MLDIALKTEIAQPLVGKAILERLKDLDDLPHFPDALVKLEYALTHDTELKIQDVVHLIALDPRLAAGLIGMVNTAKYSMGTQISDLSEAIVRIGIKDVRVMAHAVNYKTSFKSKPPFSEAHFLKHAMLSAFMAQALANALHLNAGEAFLAGLMHDIGIYLMAVENRPAYLEVIKQADFDVAKLLAAETEFFGVQHPILSARLLQQWKFPKAIIVGVAFHHAPHKAPDEFKAYAYLTFLAEQAVFRLGFDNGVVDLSPEDRANPTQSLLAALAYVGLSLEQYDQLIEHAQTEAQALEMA